MNHKHRFQLLREAFGVEEDTHTAILEDTKSKILDMARNFSAEVTVTGRQHFFVGKGRQCKKIAVAGRGSIIDGETLVNNNVVCGNVLFFIRCFLHYGHIDSCFVKLMYYT